MRFPACLAIASLAATGIHAAEVRVEAKVFIEVQADGKHCVIRKNRMPCSDSIAYLRETLKLAAGTEVGVKAHQAAPFKEVKKVLDDVGNSGFAHPVAYVVEPKKDGKK